MKIVLQVGILSSRCYGRAKKQGELIETDQGHLLLLILLPIDRVVYRAAFHFKPLESAASLATFISQLLYTVLTSQTLEVSLRSMAVQILDRSNTTPT